MWVKHQKRLSSTVPLTQSSIFFHYETLWIVIKLTLVTENPFKKPNKPNPDIFSGVALLVFPISEPKKQRGYGTPIIAGLFQGTADGDISPTTEQRWFILFQQKQHEGKISTQISLRLEGWNSGEWTAK